ncbi:MAG: glucose 1-dehydrogenase [Alteromonadales bacterium]|nr:glucose 1-dehydrogenase [Alteromonadales bacterium]MCP4987063.1 glucose 1-dehydrogenase [Colwellia sp.]
MDSIKDKVILITGAGSGIGACVAKHLAEQGALVVASDFNLESVSKQVDEINKQGGVAHSIRLDVTQESDWCQAIDFVKGKFNRLDGLVNNAGTFFQSPIEETSLDAFNRLMKINVSGVFLGIKHAISLFREQAKENEKPTGSIVNLASLAGLLALKDMGAYCASKAAVRNMTKSIAVECGTNNERIRINSINPGTIKTKMTIDGFGQEFFDEYNEDTLPIPFGEYGLPEDISPAVAFLLSDESEIVTGAEITIDGGWSTGLAGVSL